LFRVLTHVHSAVALTNLVVSENLLEIDVVISIPSQQSKYLSVQACMEVSQALFKSDWFDL